VRKLVFENMDYLGIDYDFELNDTVRGKDMMISKENSKVKVMTITTDEELVIALDTKRLSF
jgi:acetate kinase